MKKTTIAGEKPKLKTRPAISQEARENELIAMAYDLAEQQMRDGTASSQVITEFLKRGSEKHKEEISRLKEENKMLRAKTEAIKSAQHVEELYAEALNAMKIYSGQGGNENEEDIRRAH